VNERKNGEKVTEQALQAKVSYGGRGRSRGRIMSLIVEADTKIEEEEKVAGDHMIKKEFSVIIVKNMGTILMSVGMSTHQRRGKKEKKQICHRKKEIGLI